jgi:RNA polymerase sigma-32 factor
MANALTTLAATAIILSKSAQSELVSLFQATGSKSALQGLIKANIRLGFKVAKKNVRRGVDFNDLLSCAVEGIIIAAGKFDPTKGASFTTYARQWMIAKCQEHVQGNAGIVHVGSRTSKRLWSGLQKARKAVGQDATPEALAAHMGLDVDDVARCLKFMDSRGVSLDAPLSADGATVSTVVPCGNLRQDVALERTQNNERIVCALSDFAGTLSDRDRAILMGRVANEVVGTEKASADAFGCTKQRVGQIEKALRTRLASHFAREFGTEGVTQMLRASF